MMMYVKYPLSLRNVEDLLAERGIDIGHETVRFWWSSTSRSPDYFGFHPHRSRTPSPRWTTRRAEVPWHAASALPSDRGML